MKLLFLAGLIAISMPLMAQQNAPVPSNQTRTTPSGTASAAASTGTDTPALPDLTESATGYLENPFIGTQVRIRVDAAYDDRTPDRAEFFYAKCGCFRLGGADPDAPGPGPGIVTNLRFQEYTGDFEYALKPRLSVFAEIPFRGIQPIQFVPAAGTGVFPNQFGVGDIRFGFKYALRSDEDRYITVQFKSYLPTGDAESGLGTHHYSVEPDILFQKKLTDRAALSGQGGIWIPIHGSSRVPAETTGRYTGEVLSYGAGLSYKLSAPDARVRVTPVIEFLGWNVRGGRVTVPTPAGIEDANNSNIVNIKGGARLGFNRTDSIYVGYGRELTHIGWYRDILRMEYRHVF